MGDEMQLNRTRRRRDMILEVQWPKPVEPPEALMKIPGFREYHAQNLLYQERLQTTLKNLVNNLGIATNPST